MGLTSALSAFVFGKRWLFLSIDYSKTKEDLADFDPSSHEKPSNAEGPGHIDDRPTNPSTDAFNLQEEHANPTHSVGQNF